MKKNIIIIILALTTVASIVYANLKANEASKQYMLAKNNAEVANIHEQKALEIAAEAKRCQSIAVLEKERAENALMEAKTALEELKKCRSGR